MSASSLVVFGSNAGAVQLSNEKTHMAGARLQSASEWKKANGKKGNEGKRGYNEYLRTNGLASNANVASAIAKGEVLITGAKVWSSSGRIQLAGFMANKVVDPMPKADLATENARLVAELAALKAAQQPRA